MTALLDDFPLLATRLAAGLHHLLVLPRGMHRDVVLALARDQTRANRLKAFAVFSPEDAMLLHPDGSEEAVIWLRFDVALVAGKLAVSGTFPSSLETSARQARLETTVAVVRQTGYVMADLGKGGRVPTTAEIEKFSGANPNGTPLGLAPCPRCGELRGECLDEGKDGPLLVPVFCRCANWNRCARCNQPLYSRRLEAAYFNPVDRGIWYVPGFSGLGHRCGDETSQ
jgi:hypothetical protein